MNRIGAALTGEAQDPPIKSLFVFCANPVTSSPNAAKTVEGLMRDDLFTVVHELFMTDTAKYADIVLPATTQLEQVDVHRPYGHRHLQYNSRAIEPRGESRSNWDVMRALAETMGFTEAWLHAEPEDVFAEIFEASKPKNATLAGISLEQFERDGTVPLSFGASNDVPFADLTFPTPSGKVEIRCEAVIAEGMDPIPDYIPPAEFERADEDSLVMITGAAHHFVSSSMANIPTLMSKEGAPAIEINPVDAERRNIATGDAVRVSNNRGWCQLSAVVTDDVPQGVAISPKGHWAQHVPGGRNVNWTTSDAIGDLAGQSTFHSNLIWVERMPRAGM
ncbi:MAG: molybdopterin-containing oxidoreductase family protein [Chloroflexota bacterium]